MALIKFNKTGAHQVYKQSDGSRVPGASTISKIGDDGGALMNWAWQCGMDNKDFRKVRDQAADIGNLAHFMAECFLNGDEADLSEFSPKDQEVANVAYNKWLGWWQAEKLRRGIDPIKPEIQLVSNKYPYGGTLDLPARDDQGNAILADWKTSKHIYLSHLIQLSAYEYLWNEHNPTDPIMRRAVVRFGKEDSAYDFEARWLGDMRPYFDTYLCQLKLYHTKKKYGQS
jgi:hypothetical protein